MGAECRDDDTGAAIGKRLLLCCFDIRSKFGAAAAGRGRNGFVRGCKKMVEDLIYEQMVVDCFC